MVVLNKVDLVTPNAALRAQSLIQDAGLPCLLASASQNKNLVKMREFALEHVKIKYKTLGVWLMVIGLPNTGKSTVINGLKRIAFNSAHFHRSTRSAAADRGDPRFNSTKTTEGSKIVRGVKRTEAKTGAKPGLTQHLNFFQLCNEPKLFCYDTPGIMLHKNKQDPERNVKLAALGAVPDHVSGEIYIADYVLFCLNERRMFQYIDELGLNGPTNDIRFLLTHLGRCLSYQIHKDPDGQVQIIPAATFWLKLFREGRLGKLCLDHIPDVEEIARMHAIRDTTEPPGPWGPACYPAIAPGMELLKPPKPVPVERKAPKDETYGGDSWKSVQGNQGLTER